MMNWKEITSKVEWDSAIAGSGEKPVVIFKHSTTCPVSANALREYDAYLADKPNPDVDYLLVKVIESRPVSNQIAEDTGVKHESPQIICIKNKESYWKASHWSITAAHMKAVLD